jgi:hypothetical protein
MYSRPSLVWINSGEVIRINEAKDSPRRQIKKKRLKRQINVKFGNIGIAEKINKKYHCSNFFLCQKMNSRVSFSQLKPILDIFLRGFSLSSCPQSNLKVLFAPKRYVSFKVCTQPWIEFFIFSYFDLDYVASR